MYRWESISHIFGGTKGDKKGYCMYDSRAVGLLGVKSLGAD